MLVICLCPCICLCLSVSLSVMKTLSPAEQENILLKWEMARLKSETSKLRSLLLEDETENTETSDILTQP